MRNAITQPLQQSIQIDGKEVLINTSHRLFIELIQGIITDDADRTAAACFDIIGQDMSLDPQAVKIAVFGFLTANQKESKSEQGEPVFDYDIDAETVYCDFIRFYGIDLISQDVHYHKFKLLFDNLPADSQTAKRMAIRSIKNKKQADERGYNWSEVQKIKKSIEIKRQDKELESKLQQLDEIFYNS